MAFPLTLANPAAASTWAPPLSALPDSKPASKPSATSSKTPGNIAVAIPEQKKEGAANAKYLKEITATCTKSADLVLKTLEAGKVPLVLGGDHSVAAGTVSGVAEFYRRKKQKIGLLWIDAHTDMNTPDSSPSGNVHGMPLAALMGLPPVELGKIYDFSPKVQPENCVLVGIRDVDNFEKENIRKSGVEVFTMRDIDERGMRAVMEEALRMADAAPPAITSRSIWIGSIPKTHPASALPCGAAPRIAKRILPWKSSPTTDAC